MTVIIIFACALIGATAYVLWFAITNGLWVSFEKDLMTMISQAEKNANALGGLISREFSGIENKVVGAYKTVAATLADTANIVKSKGDDTIMVIKIGGDDAIDKVKTTFEKLVTEATGATKGAISTVESTATDTIEKIITTTNTSITAIKTAYSTVQTALLDTSKAVSDKSEAIIKEMTESVRAAYAVIEKGGKDAYTTVESTALDGVNKLKGVGANISTTTTTVVNQIKEGGDKTIDTISNKSTAIIAELRDGTVRLAKQIADEAVAAAAKAEAAAKEAAEKLAANKTPPTTPAAGAVSAFQDYREGFQVSEENPVPLQESLLLNLQPLAIKDTGFLGPYPKGSYKEDIATANVLKAGCRFLTLQIDYTDLKMDLSLFEVPGAPTLLIRGPDGKLLSKNSGSINDVATTIANMAFNPIVPNNRQPVLLYLHVVRAPSALNNPDDYISFLSQIADALNPLAPFHLSLTPQGNFTRQKMAEELLTTPISSLEGQVIVLCNADTSMFRGGSVNKTKYPPAKDLDFWVNMQVYLDDPTDINGITQSPDSAATPPAVLVDLTRILSLSSSQKEAFAAKGKRRYVIAMGNRTANPTPTDLNTALNNLGVNVVPIDIFTDSDKRILLLSNEYTNKSFRPKPTNLQYYSL